MTVLKNILLLFLGVYEITVSLQHDLDLEGVQESISKQLHVPRQNIDVQQHHTKLTSLKLKLTQLQQVTEKTRS